MCRAWKLSRSVSRREPCSVTKIQSQRAIEERPSGSCSQRTRLFHGGESYLWSMRRESIQRVISSCSARIHASSFRILASCLSMFRASRNPSLRPDAVRPDRFIFKGNFLRRALRSESHSDRRAIFAVEWAYDDVNETESAARKAGIENFGSPFIPSPQHRLAEGGPKAH